MSLLHELFPGIAENEWSCVPRWHNEEMPWELLSGGDSGLISQITEIVGEEGVFIHPDAIIGDFVNIEGPCYIGENTTIIDSMIGPYVSIGDNCNIEGSRIENSIIQKATQIQSANIIDSMIGNFVFYKGNGMEGEKADLSLGDYSSIN